MQPDSDSASEIEQGVGRKVLQRLVLPCALYILIGAIDRTNVSFAALQMNQDLAMSDTQYGFAAGVLFIGYVMAKFPSVILYEALGMRRWLALITSLWGLGACAMGLVIEQWHVFALRLFIGFMEGGLSSGLMIYLSQFAPDRWRATILAIPIMAIFVAQVIGAPLSGLLMDLDNPWDLPGWRFMFLIEGLPALFLATLAWFYFPDRPGEASWLTPVERSWMETHVKGATRPERGAPRDGRWNALTSPFGWICALIWFCILAGNYGVMFWLPMIVKGMSGLTATQTGLVVALPNFAAAIGLLINARHSDKTQERVLHVALPSLVGGCGLLAAFLLGPGLPGLAMLVIGGACTGCTVAAFWAIPTKVLDPRGLAMGIVLINMLGSFAGAIIPPAIGWLRQSSGSFLPPTLLLFGLAVTCALLVFGARHRLERA